MANSIKYSLYENHLTSDPEDYSARVVTDVTAELEDLIEDILNAGTTLTKPDLLAALDAYHDAIYQRLLSGRRVNLPVANFLLSIKGVFNGADDSFDPSRHLIDISINPPQSLLEKLRKDATVAKEEAKQNVPNLLEYIDYGSEERNSILTPGGIGQIRGHRLKFDADDDTQGIFFVAEDGTETKSTMVSRNKPADLMFLVPNDLTAGEYTLEVRSNMGTTELRIGRLTRPLSVAGS